MTDTIAGIITALLIVGASVTIGAAVEKHNRPYRELLKELPRWEEKLCTRYSQCADFYSLKKKELKHKKDEVPFQKQDEEGLSE